MARVFSLWFARNWSERDVKSFYFWSGVVHESFFHSLREMGEMENQREL